MTPALWSRVESIFSQAVHLDGEERRAFLEARAEGDTELLAAVQGLLAADAEVGHSVELVVARGALAWGCRGALPELAREGVTVGRYRLERKIGSGGMGEVYLATRADREYQQQVAVKLMRAAPASPFAAERFRRERQILARLEHPGIARLLDGGTTEEGYPYLVMEHILGRPIDQHCRAARLGVGERLGLFVQVCRAVTFAHERLIVHRDLKPENILVTAEGDPKLLDFGIAKLLSGEDDDPANGDDPASGDDPAKGDDPTGGAALTGQERLLTPSYASPEQIRGELVGTASDVYSLGVVLYLLLTGTLPYGRPLKGLVEAERCFDEESPALASRVAKWGEAGSEKALRRALAGDLDAILAKALAQAPEARYRSVEALARDLERHLEGLPVEARRISWSYRLGRLLRRHRWAAAAGLAFVGLLLSGAVGLSLKNRAIARERDKAQEVSRFLVDLFRFSEQGHTRPDEIRAVEVLEQGARQLDQRLETQPELQAALLETVGQAFVSLGSSRRAQPLLEQALSIRRPLLGEHHVEVASSLRSLGWSFYQQGELRRAREHLEQALATFTRAEGAGSLTAAETENDLGLCLAAEGDYAAAEAALRQALAGHERHLGPQHPAVAVTSKNLALVLVRQGRFEEAEELTRRALDIDRGHFAPPHPALASDLAALGLVLEEAGDLEGAVETHREALVIRRQVLTAGHPDVLESINNLAAALFRLGQLEEAKELFSEALAGFEARGEGGRAKAAAILNNLAILAQQQGDFSRAGELLDSALALRRLDLGNNHPDTAQSLENLARFRITRGDSAAGEALLVEALEMRRARFGADHPDVARSLASLAQLRRQLGEPREAVVLLRQALAILERAHGSEHPEAARVSGQLASVLLETAELDEAGRLLLSTLERQRVALAAEHPDLAVTLTSLGFWYTLVGRSPEAEQPLEEALLLRRKLLPAGHWATSSTESVLGAALLSQGKLDAAAELLEPSFLRLKAQLGADHPLARAAAERLARLEAARRKMAAELSTR